MFLLPLVTTLSFVCIPILIQVGKEWVDLYLWAKSPFSMGMTTIEVYLFGVNVNLLSPRQDQSDGTVLHRGISVNN